MKRSFIESLVTEKALAILNRSDGEQIIDYAVDEAEGLTKNVCAWVSTKLSDDIDSLCDLLGLSKRRFVEAALIDAVRKAQQILDDEGVVEFLEEQK
jgi:hypothetical protein